MLVSYSAKAPLNFESTEGKTAAGAVRKRRFAQRLKTDMQPRRLFVLDRIAVFIDG